MKKNEAIASAIRKNEGASVRSEDLQHYETFFVDSVNLAILEGNENQLIYGRRGTGKTLLLGTLTARINSNQDRTAAFYLTASDYAEGFRRKTKLSLVEQANAYFHSFVERLSQKLFDYIASTLEDQQQLTLLGLDGDQNKARRKRIADNLLRLIDAASVGASSLQSTDVAKMRVRLNELVESGTLDQDMISDMLQTEADSLVSARYVEFNPTKVKELLIEIVSDLKLDYIVVLIDEWMHLKRGQVEFAERLRQCLFGTDRISVKIAADQYQGRFNNAAMGQNLRGLEIGGDIMVKIDLDYPFRGPRSNELFTEALYRRLLHLEPELQSHFGEPPLSNHTYFMQSIFENEHAFEELCRGAQGICREFHGIFKDCANAVKRPGAPKLIDYAMVQRVMVDRTAKVFRSIKNPTSSTIFSDLIVPHVAGTGAHFFLTDTVNSGFSHVIDDLHSKRVIHGVPMSDQLDPVIKAKFDVYEIEYGIYLELRRKIRYNKGAVAPVELEELNSENCDAYTLNYDSIGKSANAANDMLHCDECLSDFSRYDRYYLSVGICPNPHCLTPQDSWDGGQEEDDDI